MRGEMNGQVGFSLVQPAQRVPKDHPIRRIKTFADEQLKKLSPVFDEMYAGGGRPSIPPERLLKACLLIALYSVRSERQLCERLEYDLMFRFFLDMGMDDRVFDALVLREEQGAVAGGGCGEEVLRVGGAAGGRPRADVEGALHCRWDAD